MLPGPGRRRATPTLTTPSPAGTVYGVLPDRADLVVVGAGIVGLAHAYEAHRRGLSVAIVDRDARPVGAPIVTDDGYALLMLANGTVGVWLLP